MVEVVEDNISEISSIEFDDGIIDDNFLTLAKGISSGKKDIEGGRDVGSLHCFSKLLQKYNDKQQLRRIAQHEADELKVFIAQKLFKVDGILCDEESRLAMIERCISVAKDNLEDFELDHHYGREMASWIRDRLFPAFAECTTVIKTAAKNYEMLKKLDPLSNWFHQPSEIAALIATRINRFIDQMSSKVKWSLLIDPGNFSCHLTEFMNEYRRLELITASGLSIEETSQASFNLNYLTKARNKNTPCVDHTRVKLTDNFVQPQVPYKIFESKDVETGFSKEKYGTNDFIHASYIRGGPLLNAFICSQAPMENTIQDFWRMVYQEKSSLIVMLCGATDPTVLGPLGKLSPTSYCPYYWPRHENDELQWGDILVKNKGVDETIDPLFSVTYLEVSKEGESVLRVEHWQWDWQYMGDVYWPFRILRKARLSPTPTIVHCLDGCSRSGTLVAIESVLAYFLRGTPMDDNIVLLSSVFVRLQRKFAIGSSIYYLFIYRTILHWLSPYVFSFSQRVSLGLKWKSFGFIAKYDDIVKIDSQTFRPY